MGFCGLGVKECRFLREKRCLWEDAAEALATGWAAPRGRGQDPRLSFRPRWKESSKGNVRVGGVEMVGSCSTLALSI